MPWTDPAVAGQRVGVGDAVVAGPHTHSATRAGGDATGSSIRKNDPVTTRSAVCPIRIGRDDEVARLASNMTERLVTLISGPAGMGKSRLALEALRLGDQQGLARLQGNCTQGASVPYGPFVSALRRRTRTLPEDDLDRLFDGAALLAAALLPEVASAKGLPSEPPQQEDLFAAVWQLLHRLATPTGCVLVVEDLHWADADSLRLFSYLAREIADLDVWIVGTYRSDELHRRHPLTATLAELTRARAYDEITLSPLCREELRAMVSAILDGTTVGDEFLDALLARTAGNPFFAEEVIKVLLERGDLYRDEGDWARRSMAEIEMPVSVREALLARASTLEPGQLEVLELAAIAGDQLDLPVLAAAARRPRSEIDGAVRSGLQLQLLAEHRDGPRTVYTFRHALTREAMADELVGPDRQRAHRRVAEAIATTHAEDLDAIAAQLADHYEAAGELADAVEHGLRAARSAAGSFALEEAGRRYEHVLRLMPASSAERLGVLIEAAEALLDGPDPRLVESFASEARDVARSAGDQLSEGRALSVLQRRVWDSGDTPGALALMREAYELVRGRDDRVEALETARLARLACLADRKEEAAELVRRGLEIASSVEDAQARSLLHGTRMMLASFGPEFEEALRASVRAARVVGDERAEWNVASGAGYVGLWCGDFALAKEWLLRAMELATRLSPNDRYAAAGYAWLLSLIGDYSAALDLAQSVGPSARVPAQIVALTARYEVTEKTDLDSAGAVVEELLSLAAKTGEAQRSVPATAAKARHTLLTDGIETAAPLFWEALEKTTTSRRAGSHWAFSPDMSRALCDAGVVEELTRWVDALAELTSHDAHPHNRAAQRLASAYLDAARDELGAARKGFHEAGALYGSMPCPAREAECLLGLADLEWRANDPDSSGLAARRAAVLADRLGATLLGRRAAEAARRAETPAVLATVLVTDIVASTERLSDVGDRAWSTILGRHHAIVRRELERFKGHEIDTAGDGFLATFDTPAQGIRCALALRDALRAVGIVVRAGLHTGECQIMGDKVLGLAVHLAARVNAAAKPGEVLVSRTVRDLVAGSGLSFEDRGTHTLKGIKGEWTLFSVSDASRVAGIVPHD